MQARAGDLPSFIAHALLLGGAAAAVFLTAGMPQGSAGIFLVCAGASLVLCPPSVKVNARLWLAANVLVLCASLALLPAHWFAVPAWRKAMESLLVVSLPSSITPVPWQTGFWLALLASTTLAGLFTLAQPLRSNGLLILASGAVLICSAYGGLSIYAKVTGWHYPFEGGASFGFFPNRNHTATFLITGSILAIGILSVAPRHGRWFIACLAAGCLTTCVSGLLFFSASRGGIVFLVVGVVLWIVGIGRAHRSNRLLVSLIALVLAGGAYFILAGGEARARIAAAFEHSSPPEAARASAFAGGFDAAGKTPSAAGDTPLDLRVLIYKDTLPLIRSFPITGTGLGTFAMVFPQYRNASLSEMRPVHPESDWLMLAAEAGVPALLSFVALIWMLACRLPALKEHPYWPLRWACIVATAAAVLHGFVDVPVHHVALGWWIMTLAGLGLQSGRVKTLQPASRLQHTVFVLGGVGMLILGIQLIRAEWFGAAPLPPYAAERTQREIVRAYEHHDYKRASQIARQATFASPLDETFYYEWGALKLPFSGTDAEVDQAFAAERLLDPGSPTISLRQGDAWLRYDSARVITLWRDAFSRRCRMDQVAGAGSAASVGFYRDLILRAASSPDVQRGLIAAAANKPALVVASLETARPEVVKDQLLRLSTDDYFLRKLNPDERQRFLLAWYAAGDRAELARFVDEHNDWQEAAWPIHVRQWVDAKDYERAVHEAASHYLIPLSLPPVTNEETPTLIPPEEQADPVAAFDAYWRGGNTVAAQRVLTEATVDSPASTTELWRLKAAVEAGKSEWATAWQDLHRYIQLKCGEQKF